MGKRSLGRLVMLLGMLLAWPGMAAAGDLGSAQLLIAGSRLTVSPESQTIPYDTPTIVETHLEGYDTSRGKLPDGLRVLADLTGPEIDGVLVLETVPNQPFRIPQLRLQGEYRLDNIRLVQGSTLLAYAAPRSSSVLVTQVLITKVTSRALTLDEIRSYGIVVDDSSFQAFNFTFAFAVAGETINYNVPVIYQGPASDQQAVLWGGQSFDAPPWRSSSARFEPPRMAPFQLRFESTPGDDSSGGCDDPEGDCTKPDVVPIPGVILFPTDVSLLHQFFSVVLMAQNGAPAGDRLTIRDLTAKVTLPPGLRQAKTDPPTALGVPVPVRVPGPDGKLGTADDLTFLVAQATGQAEVEVEGLSEGTHLVQFDLEGILEGLPGGQIRRITGQARGAVIVRDPTLNVTITHPDTVRTDEEYTMLLTVSNTGNVPANQLKVRLPAEKLSGVQVVGVSEKTVTVQPGDAEILDFRLKSLRTGRVTATAARSDSSSLSATFDLTVGVGENGIPLSPNAIILPRSTDSLPPDLVRNGLNLIGLGFSLATAPPALLKTGQPRISRALVDGRIYAFAQAGKEVSLGEDLFDSAAELAAEWTGARDADWDWDLLRRTTQKGAQVGVSLGTIFAAEAAAHTPRDAFDRFAKTTGYLPAMEGALATGPGVTLEITSRTNSLRLAGDGNDSARLRDLPFADLYRLGDAQMALLAVPEEGGYRARIRASAGVEAGLHLLVPGSDGTLRMVRWGTISLDAGGTATVDFRAADSAFTLEVDRQGDGIVDSEVAGTLETLQRRAFQAIAAVQNVEVDPSGHVIDVLFSTDVDPQSLIPSDPRRFTIAGKVSNGGSVKAEQDVTDGAGNTVHNPFAGLRNTRIVRVVFNNPLSPYTSQSLTVSGVKSPLGEQVTSATVQVQTAEAQPGTQVEGTVYGSDGRPVPFAQIELRESDPCLYCESACQTHKTAIVQADAAGSFLFDYVRQTGCSDIYQLKAIDAASGESGTATGRVRLIGQKVRLDVVMLGRGTVRGRVTYDDGTVPPGARVIADSPVFRQGRAASLDANGNYALSNVPVGTITLSATDGQGRFTVTTLQIPDAGSVVTHDLVILRRPDQPVSTGDVRGVIYRPDGTTPVSGAYVALYVDGNLVGVKHSAADGTFDFGPVPAGRGEVETFEGVTGQTGVQVFFDVHPDQVNQVNLVMQDHRGVVQGHVYRRSGSADPVPVFGAVVWAEGTPFQTVTGPDGSYKLEGVYTGTRNISAADPQKKVKVTEAVTVGSEGQVVDRDLYFRDTAVSGIAGAVLGFDGSPVSGATVHLANGDQYWFRTATTDSSGHFLISDLGVGAYGVHAFKGSAGGAVGATVRFAGDTPFVTIQFKKGSIHGVVQVKNGGASPVGTRAVITYRTTTVRLELVGLDLESHTLETNADGTFDLPDVLAGPYVITATNAFYGTKTVRGEVAGNGTETVEVTFDGSATGTVRGVVLAPDGVTPVPGATVKLRHPSFSDYDLTTGADGSFAFELVPPVGASFPVEVIASDGIVFRQAQVWVQLNKPGQELDLEIVLPKQGSISGQVQDANGTPVPGAVVTLQEGSYPRRNLIVNADAGGNFAYQNVFAGTVTLSAKAPSLGGLGGKTTAEITAEGQEVTGVVISLEPTGGIAGQVTSPVDGSAVPSAEVHLMRGGRLFDTVTAGPDGHFEFSLLPLATYDVTAFDPHTGRFGRRLGVAVIANEEAAGDLQLEARGSVTGHLYEAGTTAGVPGGTIRLQAYSITGFTTYSSTDADGVYEFQGIPQGTFDLFGREPVGRRRATGRGEIVSEGQQVTLDLYLDPQATLFGSVLNPIGAADGVFPNANTVIYQDGQIIGATLDSNYSFPGVVVGRSYLLTTQEVGGPHQGQVLGKLTQDGQVRVDVRMHPIGSVVVNVVDSFGHPVPGAHVDLWDQGFYSDYSGYSRFQGDTGSDNSATFQTVGEGKLSVYVTDPATGLKGSAGGWLTQEGQIVELNVALQNSAAITGHVVLSDGTTPAVQALAAVQAGGLTLTVYTDDTGAFTLSSVPLGSYLLVLEEHLGAGTREVRGNLTANGQVLDLGTLVLDAVDPQVTGVTPAAGAVDVSRNATVTVRFSEPMDTVRDFANNQVRLFDAAGNGVATDNVWQDGDTAMLITPRQPLANASIFRVKVDRNLLFDKAGRQLVQSVQTTFTTADQVPPAVIAVTPANNARQVPLASPVKVTFSEVVNPSTLSGSALQLTDVTAGAGVTTTYLVDATGRTVTVTPVAALADGHRYQFTVQGVADTVGNAMTVPFTVTFQALDATAPAITVTSPAEGTQVTSGDRLTVSANVTDLSAVTSVTLRAGSWVLAKAAAPYSWQIPAPAVTSAGPVVLEVEAVDEWGNRATATRTLQVTPRANASSPQVAIRCLPGSVPPGLEMAVPFHASDDESVASYRLLVNGQEAASEPLVDQAAVDASFLWTVPASAHPGDVYTLRIEATDFAGNVGTAEATVTVAAGTVLTADRTLDGSFAGQALVLSQGTFTLTAPLRLSALTLTRGAQLTATGSGMDLTVDGRLDVGCDASIDVSKLGFAGGNGQHAAGYAPSGVTGSQGDSGGSHGGVGDPGGATGAPGAVYDSVYQPGLAGAGGAFYNNQLGSKGGAGGGVLSLTAGELVLEGHIVAQGETRTSASELGGGGAGGAVSVQATTLRGGGSIEASGGDPSNCSAGAGGGGRVALRAGSLSGFDPGTQVKAWGGTHPGCNGLATKYAAPGTVYVFDSTSTYGRLIVDAGQAGGLDRTGPATELPALGTGAVAAWSAAGADAWVSGAAPFKPEQLGAWMTLKNGAGAALGSGFQVVEIDAQGRARLAGAATVAGAATWAGEYRFDSVDLRHGAGLRSASPVSGQEVVLQGDVAVTGDVTAVNVTVKAGARVHPVTGGTMRFQVGGRMTVEAGAVLDVRNLGYAGGDKVHHPAGYGPAGYSASQPSTGGSHGGAGGAGVNDSGPVGQVFDSVYEPGLGGGGGGVRADSFYGNFGGAGGGVVAIDAGELDLEGQILASGETRPTDEWGGGGAGGTVAVQVGTLRGAGSIDVSGGDATGCGGSGGAGGGGRVALQVQTFDGFDPAAQVKAWGGVRKDCEGTINQAYYFGAAGTIYVADATSTYGRLILDAGQQSGADRTGVATELPELAGGAVSGFQAAGEDAWVTAAAPFAPEWLGAWMTLQDAAGAPLGGGFQVAEIDAQGRVRLAGAGEVSGAASYRGEYRFDTVALSHGAGLWSRSPVTAQDITLAGTAGVGDGVSAGSLTVLAGAAVRPVSGQTLHLKASGTLTVQAGGRLDVSGLGYAGGTNSHGDGRAPDTVRGAQAGAGGNHGGTGLSATGPSANGEVYDSLFTPVLGGGGGSDEVIYYSLPGAAGGGVVQIEAGTLDLEGEIRARGVDDDDAAHAAGAGGAVWITAGTITGAGRIDASGGFARSCFYQRDVGSGGGGRVALSAGAFNGFDPATQALAQGGGRYNCDRSSATYAAAGTVFSKLPAQTYGALRVDQGAGATGSPTVAQTALPAIGRGMVGAVTVAGSDLWITPQDATAKFSLGVPGMWVVVGNADYLVIDETPDRRQLRLAGAAGHVAVGDAFHGEYKLDTLSVGGGARLTFGDDVATFTGAVTKDPSSEILYADYSAPAVALTQPTATTFTAGDPITVAATASDDAAVSQVTFSLGADSFTDSQAPYQGSMSAPPVATATDLELRAEAKDSSGNAGVATRTLHIQPLAPTSPPSVSFLYPGAGALLPVGVGLDLQLQVSDDRGVQRVELYVDNGPTPVQVLTAPYAYHLSAPAGAVDGQILNLRAVAYDYSLQTAEATIPVRVVQGTVITQSQPLTDSSLDGATVIVAGSSILTITGAHTFRDLVVLNGAMVTHPATTATQEYRLDLTVQRDLFVAQGGTIDVTGRGYLGGSGSQRAHGYGNAQTEGANPGVGGSHGGRGGSFDGSSPVYGSFYDPADPGAGGGASTSYGGASGGGVVRLTASGNVVIDGAVLADGASGGLGAGGAGGSIRVNGAAIRGAGLIHALGSASSGGTYGGGSGGRIALYAATIDPGLVSRTVAAGAKTPSINPATWGAAGTVFIKPDDAVQIFGDLILDNAGTASSQLTELLPVGSGVIDLVSPDGLTFTDNEADFRHILGAADAVFNGDFAHPCPIGGNDHHGKSLVLKTPLATTCTALPHVNDFYQGLYRFNRLIVRNGAKGIARDTVTLTSPNTPEVASGSSWTSGYAPSIQITSPAAGASYTSGASIPAAVSVTDALGVTSVAWSFASQSATVTSSPYSWTPIAPEVTQATDFQLAAATTDLSGNRLTASQTVHVNPAIDPTAPVVTLTSCPVGGVQANYVNPGDLVAPGVTIAVPFVATDDQAVQSYSLVVDGTTVQTVGNLNQASVSAYLTWTPPANAAPGTPFNLRVEARDFSGKVGSTTLTLSVPTGSILTGTQSLTSAVNGQPLILGSGTFTVQGPISPTSLRLLSGARVVGVGVASTTSITLSGALILQCGSVLDVSALGYAGSTSGTVAGGAPPGVAGSVSDSGGSHGGMGQVFGNPGPAGAVFDSVYQPQLGGGGGSLRSSGAPRHGGSGGGALVLDVGQIVLDGQILAKGDQQPSTPNGESSGAGGSVQIKATGTLSGAGRIDVSGGDRQSTSGSSTYNGGSGGGGRVALKVGALSGFDPVTQVKAWGGTIWNNTTPRSYASPGTIWVKTDADTYGRLIVDSGKEASGAERVDPLLPPQTPLPALGTGAVTAFQTDGPDAWVSAAAAFNTQWLGAWMALVDASGQALGSFKVQTIDTSGRVKLTGAAGVTGAAQYRGQYRFDRLDLKSGSGVTSGDDLIVGDVYAESKGRLPSKLTATNVTIKTGSPVTVAQGGTTSLTVSGTLTVESGAVLDVSSLGYAGSTSGTMAGGAPALVAGSISDSGGSHGGTGQVYGNPGPAGEVFDSVYQPQLGGGGGSLHSTGSPRHGGSGGGVVALNAGQIVLNGEIWAKGNQQPNTPNGESSGAGGSVQITAGTLSGAGRIDVSGADRQSGSGSSTYNGGSGGGGRVVLYVDTLSGFDPATQVKAWGGTIWSSTAPRSYASPGTVFVKLPSQTYGNLYVDQGGIVAGKAIPNTVLPTIGTGTVGTATADTLTPTALWITPSSSTAKFSLGVIGMWVKINNVEYRVIDQSADRRQVLLAGAVGAVNVGDSYRGVYHFNQVFVRGGATLQFLDDRVVDGITLDSTSHVIPSVP